MPDNREFRASLNLDVKKTQEALQRTETFIQQINERFKEGNLTIAEQRELEDMILKYATEEYKKTGDINVHLIQAERIAASLAKRYNMGYKEQQSIFTAAKSTNTEMGKLDKFAESVSSRFRGVSQWFNRLIPQTVTVRDASGQMVEKQTLAGKAIGGLVGGIKDLIKYLMPVSMISGGILVAIAKLVDYTLKLRAEAAGMYTKMGDINKAFEIMAKRGSDLSKSIGDITWKFGVSIDQAKEMMKAFIDAGVALRGMGDTIKRIADRSIQHRAIAEATGVEYAKQLELSSLLQKSFGLVGESALAIKEGLSSSTRESDYMAYYLAKSSIRFADMGFLSNDVFETMISIVKQADLLNIDYKNAVEIYTGLLALKRQDMLQRGALQFLSEQNLQTLAETATKASDLTLSSKAMIAAFAGKPFQGLLDLERMFIEPTTALETLIDATRRPVQLMAGLLSPKDAQRYLEAVTKNTEEGKIARRLTYDIYQTVLKSMGISYEQFDAIVQGGKTGAQMIERMKKVEDLSEKYTITNADLVDQGTAMLRAAGGIGAFANVVVGYLARIAELVESIFRWLPFGPKETPEEKKTREELTQSLVKTQAAQGKLSETAGAFLEAVKVAGEKATVESGVSIGAAIGKVEKEAKKWGVKFDIKTFMEVDKAAATKLLMDVWNKILDKAKKDQAVNQAGERQLMELNIPVFQSVSKPGGG